MPNRILALTIGFSLASCSWFRPDPPEYDALELASGVSVRDMVVPDQGPGVAEGDEVAVHYDLRLADGTFVESSRDTGQPMRFAVGAGTVPRGLEQGVIGMRLFGRRRVNVPSALGFGAEGRPPRIPPDATLVFDVELMELTPGKK